jgi:amidohydrolase
MQDAFIIDRPEPAFPTHRDLAELVAWRRMLHRRPELSGEEKETADEVKRMLRRLGAEEILDGLGGHGVAAVFAGREPGPTVMFRAELDGLPIEDRGVAEHRSQVAGKGHLCGHDGHMATLMALARALSRKRPQRGRVVLMFQPAEENGAGAAAVIASPAFARVRPDWAFALHNMPGRPFASAGLAAGPVNCASRGMIVRLSGSPAHASQPETGLSPANAVARLLNVFSGLNRGKAPEPGFVMATVTHVEMGGRAFGVAPGEAEIWLTLRTLLDPHMAELAQAAQKAANDAASANGLEVVIDWSDDFAHCENDAAATAVLREALEAEHLACDDAGLPMRGSEDFGRFGKDGAKSAMFFLGAGIDHPHLHTPTYDYPDELIGIGARVFLRVARRLLG